MKNHNVSAAKIIKSDKIIIFLQFLFFLTFVIIWQLLVDNKIVSDLALASPTDIMKVIIKSHDQLWIHFKVTLMEIGLGFLCGSLLAIILATVIVCSDFLAKILYPYIIALNSTAKVAIAPLILLLFGYGTLPVVIITIMICFLPLMNNVIIGFKSVDTDLLDLMRLYKANKWQIFRHARIPAALPYFFSGLRTTAIFSVKGAVIAEVFQATDKGLGFLITQGDSFFNVGVVYAASLIACLTGISFFILITFIERKVLYWHESRINVWK